MEPDPPLPLPPSSKPRVALVTSGLGNAFGGLGVLARMMVDGLADRAQVELWRLHHEWPLAFRVGALAVRASLAALRRPELVVYEHVNLARIHRLIPHLRGTPYVVILVGEEVWWPLDARRRRALEEADLLLAISQTTIDLARRDNAWLPEATVAWLGVRASPASAVSSHATPTALIVGRMDPRERRKGHDAILDAWPLVRASVPDAELVVVGDGDDQGRLVARARREGVAGVTFTGRVSDTERDALYDRSRLFLFPSRQEGFGLAAMEAAARGVPVLGVAGTVMEELFGHGDGAVLVPEASGPRIAEGAVPLLADAERAAALGRKARARVEARFLEEHFVARLRDALAPLLAPPVPRVRS